MTSPYSRRSFAEITESILEQLTRGIVDEKHVYDSSKVRYKLRTEERIRKISKVEGVVRGSRHVFSDESDYRLAENMLEWTDGTKPDQMSPFRVSYSFGDPSPISDINPGSVVRTIVEAIGREIDYLYAQMEYVYGSGFIETAGGSALDQVVALLGARRRPAQKARGVVVFGRKTPPGEGSAIEEALLYEGLSEYPLKEPSIKDVSSVRGRSGGATVRFERGTDYSLEGHSLVWVVDGRSPDQGSEFTVNYTPYQRISIPAATRVSTFSKRAEDAAAFTTLDEEVMTKNEDGTWEVEVAVAAEKPGPPGNVLPGTITLMPKPVEGVEYVINRRAMSGGSLAESDEELRERARAELKSLGRATEAALRQRVEDVPGVVRPVKIQELPIPFSADVEGRSTQFAVPGVVRIIVDGGELDEIKRVVEETRAAGVLVEVARPRLVLFSVQAVVELDGGADLERIQGLVRGNLESYIDSLQTGETVIYSRLVSLILSVDGLRDVKSAVLQAYREGRSTNFNENVSLAQDEKARFRNLSLTTPGGP